MAITRFIGQYRFLSNFYSIEITAADGITYPSVEHAYQAAKMSSLLGRQRIAALPTAGGAKRAGKALPLRKDWNTVRLDIMYDLLLRKFSDTQLTQALLDTKDEELIEGNTWNDTFWGECPRGRGDNHLGKLLMRVRTQLQQEM